MAVITMDVTADRNTGTDKRAIFNSMERPLSSSSNSTIASHDRPASVSSRVSSLTRDSSSKSVDHTKIDMAELTHLFGRTVEQEQLQEVFLRVLKQDSNKTEIALVHGRAGTGKSALVLDFKDAVTTTGTGYFCSGKYQQYQAGAQPFLAIVEAFNGLCEAIEMGPKRDTLRPAIKAVVGFNAKKIVKIVPKLALITTGSAEGVDDNEDDDDDDDELTEECFQELVTLFRHILKVVCDPLIPGASNPVVLFLDNLQWADVSSLNFISSLISEDSQNFMFIGAYRDDETSRLLSIGEAGDTTADIELRNLTLDSVHGLLVNLTGNTNEALGELAKIILLKTHGNPYSIFQFLEMLQRKELMTFSFHGHKWVWDLELIKCKTEVTQNVGNLLVEHIEKLVDGSKKVLKLAACIGFCFDHKILEKIALHLNLLEDELQQSMSDAMKAMKVVLHDAATGGLIHPDQVQAVMTSQLELKNKDPDASLRNSFYEDTIGSILQEATAEGLIGRTASRNKYKFSHELVHKSLYCMTPEGTERGLMHIRIGEVMRAFYAAREEDEILFVAVDHLNRGSAHLDNDMERMDLIRLNLRASGKAKAKSAPFSAADFLKKAIDLLNIESDWWNHYGLSLQIYNEAAEMEFACGRFDLSLRRCAEVLRNGLCLRDKLRAACVRIQVLQAQRKSSEAIKACLSTLSQLDEEFPTKPVRPHVLLEMRRMKKALRGWTDQDLLSIPLMRHTLKVETMRFLSLVTLISLHHVADENMTTLVILRTMRITLQHGLCDYTPFAYATYGMLLSSSGHAKDGFKYGALSLRLCDRLERNTCLPGTNLIVFTMLDHLTNPLLDGVEPLLKGYRIGVQNGDAQYASTCIVASASIGFACALPLEAYAEDLKNACEQLKLLKQDFALALVAPFWQSALNLSGESVDPKLLTNGALNALDENFFLHNESIPEGHKGAWLVNYFQIHYITAYIFNDIALAHKRRKKMRKNHKNNLADSHFMNHLDILFSGLLGFARYRNGRKWRGLWEAKTMLKLMENNVKQGMANCRGMLLFLQAENEALAGREDIAKKLFDGAMKSFASSGFIHLQAIAAERAAEFMLKAGTLCWFETYIRLAARLYLEWGAAGKVNQLVEQHNLPAKLKEAPPVISIEGGKKSIFIPIEGHIDEGRLSADLYL
jgi:predicted ATPase